jgi:hypothetical protein
VEDEGKAAETRRSEKAEAYGGDRHEKRGTKYLKTEETGKRYRRRKKEISGIWRRRQ